MKYYVIIHCSLLLYMSVIINSQDYIANDVAVITQLGVSLSNSPINHKSRNE